MKKISFVILLILIVSLSFAKTYDIDFGTKENTVRLQENNYRKLSMNLTFEGMSSFEVETQKGIFNEIIIPRTYSIGEVGTPKLPAMKKLIEIPFGAEVSVNVLNYSTTEYNLSDFGINNPIIPVQPSLPKSIEDISSVEFEYNENYYSLNRFSDFELATVEILGVMRGMRLARLVIAPVNYNPVTGIIQVYNEIELEVNFTGSDIELSKNIKASTSSPFFEAVYQRIDNYRVDHDYPDHPDLTTYPVKYLIVSDRMFESTLSDFIEWKTKKGFNVIVAYTDEIGTSYSQIQTYIHNQYNNGTPEDPAPSFVLFVGDTGQIPATTGSSSGKMTDLYYCSVDGDYFPEMYYGRLSATNTTQLQAQINKILYYEKYEFTDPTYLDNVTLIAGADATWNPNVGQPTIIYGTNNYFNTAHGYADVHSYLTTYTGCYDTVDDGIGFINYTAHCSQTSWGTPSLSQSDVNAFTNNGKYPLAIGNCCLAADFGYSECIGETWMRKANGGAVGYIGSSPSSYWFEDFYWSVGAFPIVGNNDGYVPTYEETTWGAYDAGFMSDYVSQDALVFVGNLAVTEVDIQGYPSHSSPLYYWQAYNTLGDPSLVIYNTQGSINTVNFDAILPIGVETFNVEAEAGSYVGISMNGILYGAALVDETGSVDVPITPFTTAGTADIVVTKPQYQPVITTVNVNTIAGPYVTIESYIISAGGDDVIEPGETVYLTVTLKNVGNDPATNVNMILSESDTYITLTDSYEAFGTIAPDVSVTRTNAYIFTVSNSVPDNHSIQLDAEIVASEASWYDEINLTASNPPDISIDPFSYNVNLQTGQTIDENLRISNNGGGDLTFEITQEDRDSGGPDNFGYSWIDSDEPDGPEYSWRDISGMGTPVSFTHNDQATDLMPIGFTFNYYGIDYTQFRINPNGWIGFGDDWIDYHNYELPRADAPKPAIFGFWDDLDPINGGNVYYYSTPDSLVVWFDDVIHYVGNWTGTYDFEMILYANGRILFQYRTVSGDIDTSTIGIQNEAGNDGLQVSFDENYVHNELAILFSTDWLKIYPISGTIPQSSFDDITITFDASGLPEGTYYKNIIITSNDTDEPTVTIPVTLNIGTVVPPNIPENVAVEIVGTNVQISWSAVSGATLYTVYSDSDPYGTFSYSEWTGSSTSWSEALTGEMKFYRVTASNN